MAKIKLLLDEDVHFPLGVALRKRGFDVLHAQELNRKGCSDQEQLIYAVESQRCLYSFNVKDFVVLHNLYQNQGSKHWGILVSPQTSISDSLRRILRIFQQFSQDEVQNQLLFI